MPVIIEEPMSETLVNGKNVFGLQEALEEAHSNTRAIIEIVGRTSGSHEVGAAVEAARNSVRALDQKINALHSSVASQAVKKKSKPVRPKASIWGVQHQVRSSPLCWGEG